MRGIVNLLVFAGVIVGLCVSMFGIPLAVIWVALVFAGAEGRAAKAKTAINKVLMADEQIIAHGVQHRIFALFNRRALLAITPSRVLVVRRGILGGFKMVDIQWKDLLDVKIDQNILGDLCGSNLKFVHLNRSLPAIDVEGIPNDAGSAMYAKAQAEEQAWEEKRRVRAMEEVRAAAGGVVVHAPAAAAAPAAGNRVLEEIQKAKELLDRGAVSDAEFQEMKSKILAAS